MLKFITHDITPETTEGEVNDVLMSNPVAFMFMMDVSGRLKRLWIAIKTPDANVNIDEKLN